MINSAYIMYDVVNTSEDIVNVDIKIGHGQLATTLVKLGDVDLGSHVGSFNLDLGTCKHVVKKTAQLITTIQDINPDTNKVSMVMELTGGKKPYSHTVIDSSVPSDGQVISAIVLIAFI